MGERWGRVLTAVRAPRFDRVLVPLFFTAFALARAGRFEERDPYWQARAGMENLAGWPLIRPDTWSWAGVAGPWFQNSPLWNTGLGGSYLLGGFWGFFAFTAAVMIGYFALDYVLALQLGARRLPALVAIMATVSPALAMLSPRATLMVEMLMLASVWVVIALSRRDLSRLPTLALGALVAVIAVALSVLGNQMHLSFLLLGPALGGVWGVVWLLTPISWPRRITAAAAGGIGWVAGVLATPYGVGLGLERTRVVQEVCAGLILEWTTPFSLEISKVFWLMVFAAAVAAAVVTVWLWRRFRSGGWSSAETGVLALALIGVPAAIAGWWAIRWLGIALLMLAPAVAVAATWWLDQARGRWGGRPAGRWGEYTTGGFWRVVVAAVLVLLSPGVAYLTSLHAVPAEAGVLRQLPPGCQLFSSGAIGGASILVRPDVRVWMDGRADYYGRAHLIDGYGYFFQTNATPVPPGATCVVIDSSASDSGLLLAGVEGSPRWRLAASDGPFRLFLPVG